jgi:hypothetical protein
MYQDPSSALLRGAPGRRGSGAIPVGRLAHHSTAAGPHRRPSVISGRPDGSQGPAARPIASRHGSRPRALAERHWRTRCLAAARDHHHRPPQGMMLAADRGHEAMLLELAYELEQAQPWPLLRDA